MCWYALRILKLIQIFFCSLAVVALLVCMFFVTLTGTMTAMLVVVFILILMVNIGLSGYVYFSLDDRQVKQYFDIVKNEDFIRL